MTTRNQPTKSELNAVVETYEGMIRLGNAPVWVYEAWTAAKVRLLESK